MPAQAGMASLTKYYLQSFLLYQCCRAGISFPVPGAFSIYEKQEVQRFAASFAGKEKEGGIL